MSFQRSCVVQKFGGTSVATLERIKHVAEIIAATHEHKDVVAVVSAMAGVTNKFVNYVHNVGSKEGDPEYDKVVSAGELITAGLLAIALKNIGINARSYSAWQVPIITDENFGQATISEINPQKLREDMTAGIVPIVSGFQGITRDGRVTTLGRGGSDFSAVAISAALRADLCEIYSDVDGVYTVDPNLSANARLIPQINYADMLDMSAHGAKILQEQSVAYAMETNVVVRVASSFVDTGGTIISSIMREMDYCGIAVTQNLTALKVCNSENFEAALEMLNKNFIAADPIENKKYTLFIDKKKFEAAQNILKAQKIETKRELLKRHFSKISIVGRAANVTTCSKIQKILDDNGMNIFQCNAGSHRINIIIPGEQLLSVVNFLHDYCRLGDADKIESEKFKKQGVKTA